MSTEETQNENPDIIGKLSDEERDSLTQMRQHSQEVLIKIGQIRVQEMRLLARLDQMDAGAQEIMNKISSRLEVPEGQQWIALQDGSIRLVKSNAAAES